MEKDEILEIFGKFIISNLRDSSIDFCDKLLRGYWKALKLQNLQQDLQQFTLEQKEIIQKSVVASIDTAIHDFLFALEENDESSNNIKIFVNDQDITDLGVCLRDLLFTKDGWFETFSRYKIKF
ncbi:MAG TPA: hypothetical protein VMZ29_00090 [Candidatus Bathyarchaeia archaeon]|nr:hypothetical protein [Candidatus Bathyarchaeia archaeon]